MVYVNGPALLLQIKSTNILVKIIYNLRACSHGGGGPQVGEVPHVPVVKES